jgi:glycosyltransferase involved in cell wall biosynthesis
MALELSFDRQQSQNSPSGTPDDYKRSLELVEAGRHQEALACIEQYLRNAPNDGQALNDCGAILHCLGRTEQAVESLLKAKAIMGQCAEVVWNLVEANLALDKPDAVVPLLDDMERMGILNADVLNRTANAFLQQGNKADAVEMLLRSLEVLPDQDILNRMIEVIQTKRPKIAFFNGLKGDATFLTDIYEHTRYRYLVQSAEVQNIDQMYEVMKTSDISWFEWCTSMVVEASKLPKVCKNIVRLHRFEAYTDWPSQVKWENIDTLITVGNSFVKDTLLAQVPDIESRTRLVTIPNGVNLKKYEFVNRHRGRNIACVGHLNLHKNPMLLLQCMQKLHYIDREYKLFFAGSFQDLWLEQYIRHTVEVLGLGDVVFFDGWQSDVHSWLRDKHYIVSTSIGESQGMGLLEGMACGLKPVIHNFPGADQIFPSEFLFGITGQVCEQVLSDEYDPQMYRRFVEDNYSLEKQLNMINSIYAQLEVEIDAQQSGIVPRDASVSASVGIETFSDVGFRPSSQFQEILK